MSEQSKIPMDGAPAQPKQRLFYLDNVRLLVIIIVVTVHIACMYSGLGATFYYAETKKLSLIGVFYIEFNQAYFMGLLFLIAGYFVPGSYEKKGLGKFIGDRAIRLLIPTLLFMVILMPIVKLVELGNPVSFSLRGFLTSYSVMWFAIALFIFSAIYAIVRKLGRGGKTAAAAADKTPTPGRLWVLILLITVCAFILRLFFKIGTGQFGMELCYFASYIILFIMGTYAKKHDIFSQIKYHSGKRWLIAGILVGVLGWFAVDGLALLTKQPAGLAGSLNFFNALYALWESFTGVAICYGLLGVFKEKCNRQSKLVKAMSDSSFAVYVFHTPILVGIAVLAGPIAIPLFLKWVIMCVVCIPVCFTISYYLRKLPPLNKIL